MSQFCTLSPIVTLHSRLAVVLFAVLGALVAGPLAAQPDAFELLAQVRQAYQELGTYRDRGEIEIVERFGKPRHLRFGTLVDAADAFRLVVQSAEDPEAGHRILGRDGDDVFLLDVALGQYRRMESLAAGIAAILDEDGTEALVVAGLLAGSSETLANPEEATVEGEQPCGSSSTCYLLSLSRMSGIIDSRLWVDRESLLIRRLEVEFLPPGKVFAKLLAEAGQAPPPDPTESSAESTIISVKHEIGAIDQPPLLPEVAGGLPEGARLVEEWEIPMELVAEDWDPEEPQLLFADEISVNLFSVVVRVVDGKGNALLGLGPEDFRVWGDSGEMTVTAVDWVSSDPDHRDEQLLARLAAAGVRLEPPEKRVIFFVQSALHPLRIRGHLRTFPHVRELVALLEANDRAAVVSFDSHLKLWADFTRDHEIVVEALGKAIGFGGRPRADEPSADNGPKAARRQRWRSTAARKKPRAVDRGELSLAEHLDVRAAQDAKTPEQALKVLGTALRPLSGEKVLIYLGWGLGRHGPGRPRMTSDFAPAVRALRAAQTTVFVLDVAYFSEHSLARGLRLIAAQTGGTYAKTSGFAQQATRRLARTIAGYYVLMLDGSHLRDRRVHVELREKEGRVLSR